MSYTNKMALCLCLCVCVSISVLKLESKSERNKKMNDQKESKWLINLKKTTKSSGRFEGKDKTGASVIFDWTRLNVQSPEFAKTLKKVGDICAEPYVSVESDFFRANPNLELDDYYLKQFEPFFLNGFENVNWPGVEEKIQQVMKQFHSMDCSKFNPEFMYFFVIVKDKKTEKELGEAIFFIAPEYPFGDIKCIDFAVATSEQGRGLGKLIMSSILRIIPDLNRIFLCTRPTNTKAMNCYRACGFTVDADPIQEIHCKMKPGHWSSFEYKADLSNVLQNISKKLIDIK